MGKLCCVLIFGELKLKKGEKKADLSICVIVHQRDIDLGTCWRIDLIQVSNERRTKGFGKRNNNYRFFFYCIRKNIYTTRNIRKRMKQVSSILAAAFGLIYTANGQTCTNAGLSFGDRFEPPVTDAVCFNISTANCPNGATYFGIDYDCNVASEGAERCFCTSDDRFVVFFYFFHFIFFYFHSFCFYFCLNNTFD